MTASAEPAAWIRLEMSGRPEAESCDGLCECMFPREIVDIAESIDEVRGIGRISERFITAVRGGDVVDRGDGGEELPGAVDCEDGEDTFRSWLYEWVFGGDAVAFLMDPASIPLTLPFVCVSPITLRSSNGKPG